MTLISAAELATRIDDPDLRIGDVRWALLDPEAGRRAYDEGHIPGAVHIDLDRDLAAAARGPNPLGGRHPLPDPLAFARRMGELGIGSEHVVVAYDDTGGTVAARLWWMLDDLGHPRVELLDGGLAAWRAAGMALTTDVPVREPARMSLRGTWSRTIDRDRLRERLGTVRVLDARAGERYRGETEPVDPVAGHIPTAESAPATANLGSDGRFLDPEALAARYRHLRGDADEVVVYCGSGVTATHAALAMRHAGLPPPIVYDGSWSDWSTAGLPIATGPEPGEPPGR